MGVVSTQFWALAMTTTSRAVCGNRISMNTEFEDRIARTPSCDANSDAAELAAAGGREPELIGPNPQPAPSTLFTEYAQALFRATQVRSLQKMQEAFWQQREWPEKDEAACDRLDAIFKSHERRTRGEIDAKRCAEEMKELITGDL